MSEQKRDGPQPGRSYLPQRGYLLDFAKGLLVLSMVVYHALNYTMNDSVIFNYLRFIAPGFVGLSGFVVTKYLRDRYASREGLLYLRLVGRGAKLVGLFTLLNLLIILAFGSKLGKGLAGLREYAGNLKAIYLAGAEGAASFGVLLPIGYLLLLSPLLLEAARLHAALLGLLAAAFLAASWLGPLYGLSSQNFLGLTFGVLGLAAGALPVRWSPRAWTTIAAVLLLAGGYLAAAALLGPSFPVVLGGTIAALLLFWLVGSQARLETPVVALVLRWGRYSLFAYISQIAILQALRRLGIGTLPPWRQLLILGFSTLLLTAALIEALDWAASKSSPVRKIYRAIFA